MTTSRTSGVLTDEGENNARVNGSHSREMGFLKNKGKGQNENTVTKNACIRFPHRRGKPRAESVRLAGGQWEVLKINTNRNNNDNKPERHIQEL